MTKLTVVGDANSRAARVLWLLEEIGEPYEHIAAKPRSEKALEVNPAGKIPVLLVDGAPVTDSTAIMTFLADRFGKFTAPAGTLERARQDAMTQAVLDEFDALLWTAARHSFMLPPEQRVPEIKASLRWELERNQKLMAERLGSKPYLTGDAPMVPDFILAHCVYWAKSAKFEITEPLIVAHFERMWDRPAYRKLTGR